MSVPGESYWTPEMRRVEAASADAVIVIGGNTDERTLPLVGVILRSRVAAHSVAVPVEPVGVVASHIDRAIYVGAVEVVGDRQAW